MLQSSSIADLQSKYDSAVAIGGSGYVWQGEDTHYLIALIYPREDMANSVIGSNNIPGFDLQVVEFNIPTIDYDLQDLDSTNIGVVQNALNKCIALADILYDLTIDCQLGEISTIACASSINNYKGELQGYTKSVSNILENYPSSDISHLQEVLIKCTNILDTMVNDLLTNDMVGNIMKYSYCEYIYMLCNY
ncbi:MAG: hypothetical protein E7361_03500 [Clostridiales bacterium]|nr:hypothetical protein [Clostridiales bacterium]